jgi:oxygen-independent coproporphyrinogen-3 oxidase
MAKPLILDLHIPYCIKPEKYLRHYNAQGSNAEKNAYMAALKREVLSYEGELDEYEIRAVRLGGGSATVMAPDLLGDLLTCVRHTLPVARGAEVSFDAQPLTIGTPSLSGIGAGHPTRVELMMRSENDAELRALGCAHTMQNTRNAMLFLNKFHMNNIGLTVNYGIPGQTMVSWHNTLHACTIMRPAHIHTEALVLPQQPEAGMPNEEERLALFAHAAEFLTQEGYQMYAAGHFCLPEHEYRFDTLAMNGVEIIGMGVNAGSVWGGMAVRNTNNCALYIRNAGDVEKTTAEAAELDAETQMRRYLAGRMQTAQGLAEAQFEARFAQPLPAALRAELEQQQRDGLAERTAEGWKPTIRGLFRVNTL